VNGYAPDDSNIMPQAMLDQEDPPRPPGNPSGLSMQLSCPAFHVIVLPPIHCSAGPLVPFWDRFNLGPI
jgi:hypothetical protein